MGIKHCSPYSLVESVINYFRFLFMAQGSLLPFKEFPGRCLLKANALEYATVLAL
jgi:hypothetical protein